MGTWPFYTKSIHTSNEIINNFCENVEILQSFTLKREKIVEGVDEPMVKVHPVQLGKNVRMSFSRINEVLEMPNLIEVQKNSYQWFLDEGLKEVFRDVSAITDYTGNLVLDFIDYRLDDKPKYTVEECKERDVTYAAPLRVRTSLLNKETGEIKEQEIFMGDFPLMTDSGTFVINGAERVIVSQLVRSPGVYYDCKYDKSGKKLFSATVIPNRGAWLEYETDSNDVFYVRIDKTAKSRLLYLSARWAPAPTRRLSTSSGRTTASTPPFKKILPRAWKKACWRYTASCVRRAAPRWKAQAPIWTACSLTPQLRFVQGRAL